MSLGALLGGIALHAKMVYGHSIGYTIATRYRLAHGVSCGLPLPYIISNYAVACAPKMKKLAEAYGVESAGETWTRRGRCRREGEEHRSHLKVPTTLKELGVPEERAGRASRGVYDHVPEAEQPAGLRREEHGPAVPTDVGGQPRAHSRANFIHGRRSAGGQIHTEDANRRPAGGRSGSRHDPGGEPGDRERRWILCQRGAERMRRGP